MNFAVSAGNDDGDACLQSPAHVPVAITVAATEVTDVTASFTSYGSCVDIHAPGVDVLSAAPLNSTDIKSGTSMAAPHVAGVIARYLSTTTGPPPSPQERHRMATGCCDSGRCKFLGPRPLLFAQSASLWQLQPGGIAEKIT